MTEAPRGGEPWAALFPGQGSQSVGMGRDLAEAWPEAAEVFREADDVLSEPLSRLCFEGPADELQLSRNTQPALLTVSTAAWRVIASRVPAPVAAAGHSLGEYSALVAAGVLPFDGALRAVRVRGEAMQAAVPVGEGAMAAVVGLDADAVTALCGDVAHDGEVLVPANFNAPDQVVVAGHARAVERLAAAAPEAGARRVVPLAVSAPFHSPLMRPAEDPLRRALDQVALGEARFPVLANVDAKPVTSGEAARERLLRQVAAPVRWVATMRALEDGHGARLGLEVGPGRVLAGLSRRINESLRVLACGTREAVEAAVRQMTGAAPQREARET